MGTTYTVKIVEPPARVDANTVRTTIEEVLARIDREMSGYRSDSEIVRFNASAATDWIAVSADLAEVIEIAQRVSAQSGGAFDVTVGPLVNAWGFGPDGPTDEVPSDAALSAIRERVGYEKLHVRRETPALRKDAPELALDLNGIAPGFAADLLAQRFRTLQIDRFMIEIGGEVRAQGRNAHDEPWRIAIEHPAATPSTAYAVVQFDRMAVSTSGEYRHVYFRNGRRYSHTIDPRTARPIEHDLASVVVIDSATARADAWATAYNVLGSAEGYELACRLGMPVMFIERRGNDVAHRMTPQFAKFLAKRD
ncbi:MAG TPA: FAD:protein FMN transferase [Steroidobacter sp.]|jgi:thiamine biosynthesis lipoprotein|nr:FAD:protein FMN transferase [Steroidobacter sp.]